MKAKDLAAKLMETPELEVFKQDFCWETLTVTFMPLELDEVIPERRGICLTKENDLSGAYGDPVDDEGNIEYDFIRIT